MTAVYTCKRYYGSRFEQCTKNNGGGDPTWNHADHWQWRKSIRNERDVVYQWTLAQWLNAYGPCIFFVFPRYQNIAMVIIECRESYNVCERFTRGVVESANTSVNINANNMHIIALFDKFIRFNRKISREHKFAPCNVSWLFRSGRQETAIYHRSWKPTAFASSIKFVRGFHLRIIFHFRLQEHSIKLINRYKSDTIARRIRTSIHRKFKNWCEMIIIANHNADRL